MVARRSSLLWTILFDNVACFVCTASLLTITIVFFATVEVGTYNLTNSLAITLIDDCSQEGLRTAMMPYSNAFTTMIGSKILLNTRRVQVTELKGSSPNTTNAGDLSTFCVRPMGSCILVDHAGSSEKHMDHHTRATFIESYLNSHNSNPECGA